MNRIMRGSHVDDVLQLEEHLTVIWTSLPRNQARHGESFASGPWRSLANWIHTQTFSKHNKTLCLTIHLTAAYSPWQSPESIMTTLRISRALTSSDLCQIVNTSISCLWDLVTYAMR